MSAQYLIIIGSAILGLLGLLHLIYVLTTNKFNAYNNDVTLAMQDTSPVITKHTSMWRAWLGFNYSHSFGLLWVPLIYLPLVWKDTAILQQSLWLSALLPFIALVYALLAKRYWFNAPFIGSIIALACFLSAFYVLHWQ